WTISENSHRKIAGKKSANPLTRLPLSQIIACATVNAARVFPSFDDRGTLNVGAPADVAMLELREGTFEFLDNYKGTRTGHQRLFPAATVLAGKQVQRA